MPSDARMEAEKCRIALWRLVRQLRERLLIYEGNIEECDVRSSDESHEHHEAADSPLLSMTMEHMAEGLEFLAEGWLECGGPSFLGIEPPPYRSRRGFPRSVVKPPRMVEGPPRVVARKDLPEDIGAFVTDMLDTTEDGHGDEHTALYWDAPMYVLGQIPGGIHLQPPRLVPVCSEPHGLALIEELTKPQEEPEIEYMEDSVLCLTHPDDAGEA